MLVRIELATLILLTLATFGNSFTPSSRVQGSLVPTLTSLNSQKTTASSRRSFLSIPVAVASMSFLSPTTSSNALDIDAFISKELSSEKPKGQLTEDEALCKFGAPGADKGEACERAGMSTAGRNNGVDAYGKVDRGTYVVCKYRWEIIDGEYTKITTCK